MEFIEIDGKVVVRLIDIKYVEKQLDGNTCVELYANGERIIFLDKSGDEYHRIRNILLVRC